LLLGLLFLSTGLMKFAVPELRAAFSGQLVGAGLPLHATSMWLVPAAEMGLGVLFLLGLLVRVASLGGVVLMAAATYVHVVVDDPALFPLQPEQPIVPVVAAALCLYLLRVGAGSWSLDLRARRSGRASSRHPGRPHAAGCAWRSSRVAGRDTAGS
jgi:uncharacterized membrane protein YphA (DoxX/SURF4 family)